MQTTAVPITYKSHSMENLPQEASIMHESASACWRFDLVSSCSPTPTLLDWFSWGKIIVGLNVVLI